MQNENCESRYKICLHISGKLIMHGMVKVSLFIILKYHAVFYYNFAPRFHHQYFLGQMQITYPYKMTSYLFVLS